MNKGKKSIITAESIETQKAPLPKGHYSQAVVHNGIVYVSGQLPIEPVSGKIVEGHIEAQARQALENISAILAEAGSGLNKVLKCNIYISNVEYWPAVNNIYAEFFGSHKPARAIIPVNELHHGCKIEIDAVAAK